MTHRTGPYDAAMTVLIVATGTQGDISPFLGLATRLRAAGHPVALATYEAFAEQVRRNNCEFRPLPGDPRTLGVAEQGRIEKGRNRRLTPRRRMAEEDTCGTWKSSVTV